MRVHPLTRQRPDGTLLQRSPQVEAQIVGALALSPDELIQRAALRDSQATDYLQEETLVYLTRAFHRVGNIVLVNALSEALLRRCTQCTRQKLRALGRREAEEAYGEVVCQLFERILDPNTDRGDFLQVRFWFVLKRLTIPIFGRYMKRINEEKRRLVPLANLAGKDLERGDDASDRNQTGSIPTAALVEPATPIERKILGKEGLNAIQEPHRTAFILHYECGPEPPAYAARPTILGEAGTGRALCEPPGTGTSL